MTKEEIWLKKRIGRPTSSKIKTLKTGGRRSLTPIEQVAASLVKDRRTTIDVEFGDSAVGYLYELMYERKTQQPTYTPDNRNFDWGKKQEPYAVRWMQENHPELETKHCSGEDFEEIVFHIAECGLGDSPDTYCNSDAIGEIKCVMSGAKLMQIKEMTKEEAAEEHIDQFCGHFIGAPWAKRLVYVAYLGMNDEDPFDLIDPMHPDRGIIFEYDRSEFEPLILEIEAKVSRVMKFLAAVDRGEVKVREINNWQG